MMTHRFALVLAGALSLCSVRAYAQSASHPNVGEEGNRKFPMPAADFRQHVSARLEKARARMEEHIVTGQLTPEQAAAARTTFNASVSQINAKVDEVTADGTVTKEEGEAVHELVRSLLHHGHDNK